MDIEMLLVAIAAIVAIAYYIFAWYKKATEPTSPGGVSITVEELMELIKNPEFLDKLEKVLKALADLKKEEAEDDAVPQ